MKFSLGTTGADSINQGIGSVFKTLAAAPQLRQQAEMDAALRTAQAFNQNASGNKHQAEADGMTYTLSQRKGVEDLIAANPDMQEYARNMFRTFGLTGDTNAERVAKSGSEFQQQDAITQIQGGMDPTRTGQAYAAVSGKMPFTNVGNTGRNINGLTGMGSIIEGALASNYDSKTKSEINENNAQAANAYSSAEERKAKSARANAGLGKPLTASQLRENVAITEARERISGMQQADIEALMAKDSFSLTAGDKALLASIKIAHKPMFGEDSFVPVSPVPTPPAPPEQPGILSRLFSAVTDRGGSAKSPGTPALPSNIEDKAPSSAESVRAAFKAGKISRDEAKRQLQRMGYD